MNGTNTQDCNQRKHVREHVLADAALQLMNGETPVLRPSVQSHLDGCERCASRLEELRAIMSIERDDAVAEADAAFPEERLLEQRSSILSKLEQARAGSRVLHFPTFPGTRTWMARRDRPAMRWLAGAAAAGLLVGLGAGQAAFTGHQLRFHPTSAAAGPADATSAWMPVRWISASAPDANHPPERLTGAAEEAFLSDMELVLHKRRNAAMRALDESLAPNGKDRHAHRK